MDKTILINSEEVGVLLKYKRFLNLEGYDFLIDYYKAIIELQEMDKENDK